MAGYFYVSPACELLFSHSLLITALKIYIRCSGHHFFPQCAACFFLFYFPVCTCSPSFSYHAPSFLSARFSFVFGNDVPLCMLSEEFGIGKVGSGSTSGPWEGPYHESDIHDDYWEITHQVDPDAPGWHCVQDLYSRGPTLPGNASWTMQIIRVPPGEMMGACYFQ